MQVHLVSPLALKMFEALWVEFHTPLGNFVIQEGHAPMILVLAPDSALTLGLLDGIEQQITIKGGGIVQVMRTHINFLLDQGPSL